MLREHGEGPPLLLLHGAYMTADSMGPLLPGLAESRQVIVSEQQAHGRTADVDRPITYEQVADDNAALLTHLGIERADVVGYSTGGGIALQLAIRHPALVKKSLVASASFAHDGMHAEAIAVFATITAELFALFRMLGGGVMGDLAGLPTSQLAVLPGTTHFMPPGSGLLDRAAWLLPMIDEFLADKPPVDDSPGGD